ncbi:unnamed protein product [Pleuronectes platessa]|uniref:Phospholamban n=1 Tax=Pleuronectes platessa TaxID=8262 RepID=A0A9N7TLE5_PLEPL|nr:unnamed protein product [Pleuronectes platessa]
MFPPRLTGRGLSSCGLLPQTHPGQDVQLPGPIRDILTRRNLRNWNDCTEENSVKEQGASYNKHSVSSSRSGLRSALPGISPCKAAELNGCWQASADTSVQLSNHRSVYSEAGKQGDKKRREEKRSSHLLTSPARPASRVQHMTKSAIRRASMIEVTPQVKRNLQELFVNFTLILICLLLIYIIVLLSS